MRVLFVGGTGIISSACAELAVQHGMDLYFLNRGQSSRLVPEGVHQLRADVRDTEDVVRVLEGRSFDVVVNWVAYTSEHIEADLSVFSGRTNQYVFISSASAYETPPGRLPVTEKTPLSNPFWQYSRDKIACERRLERAYRETAFPYTIVRPSHTYDERTLPLQGGYTSIARMRQGKEVIIHGDGTSVWTLTHHRDFAKGFVGLLGNAAAVKEAFHITSDEWLTWNQIYQTLAAAAGVEAKIVHIASETIAAADPAWGAGLLGDKAHSMLFDNAKIKNWVPGFEATIPFSEGAREIMAWFDGDASRHRVDAGLDARMDALLASHTRR